MKINISIKGDELPRKANHLRKCIEHIIFQHNEDLSKSDINDQINQIAKKIDYKAINTSVKKARKNVEFTKKVMLKKIDEILSGI